VVDEAQHIRQIANEWKGPPVSGGPFHIPVPARHPGCSRQVASPYAPLRYSACRNRNAAQLYVK
jgi:hypothetical protein